MKRVMLFTLLGFFLGFSMLQATERPQRAGAQKVSISAVPVAPSILSIIPAHGEPGSKVTIFGNSFGEKASAFLGSIEIPARVMDGKQLEFVIPQLAAGLYALYIKRGDGSTGRVYNFSVEPVKPVLTSLIPDSISTCAQGANRDVIVTGKNFIEASVLLFDGAVLSSRFVSSEQVVFNVPQATGGGLHQIMVRNEPENGSLPLTFTYESRPEINQVSIGSEHVNSYDLNIYGKNFQQNSTLYVDGQRIGGKVQDMGEREKLIFTDCTRLVYQRYPYSSANKDFRIQVINNSGEASQVVNVTAP